MKIVTGTVAVVSVAMLFSSMPVFGFGSRVGRYGEILDYQAPYNQEAGRDECLLLAQNCGNKTDTIQQRIMRLTNEIRKGTAVYTPDELNQLKRQLRDEYQYFDDLNKPGEGHSRR